MATDYYVIQLSVPVSRILWQATCVDCGARYGVMQGESVSLHPVYCAFCGHRPIFVRVSAD